MLSQPIPSIRVDNAKMLKENLFFLPAGSQGIIHIYGAGTLTISITKLISEDDLMMRGIYSVEITVDKKEMETVHIRFEKTEEKFGKKFFLSEPYHYSIPLSEGEHTLTIKTGERFIGTGILLSFSFIPEEKKERTLKIKAVEPPEDVRKKFILIGFGAGYSFGISDSYIRDPIFSLEVGLCPSGAEGRLCISLRGDYSSSAESEDRTDYSVNYAIDIYRLNILIYYREFISKKMLVEITAGGGFFPVKFRYHYSDPSLMPPLNSTYTGWSITSGGGLGFAIGPGEFILRSLVFLSRIFEDERISGNFIGSVSVNGEYRLRF